MRVREAIHDVVAKQTDIGIDVINDVEMSKPSHSTFVKDRLDLVLIPCVTERVLRLQVSWRCFYSARSSVGVR
jgi:hypothetical protein